jgi:short-subunit dehydrogenase
MTMSKQDPRRGPDHRRLHRHRRHLCRPPGPAGHDLILVARDTGRLGALAAKLRGATGVKVDILTADLTNKADLAKVEARLADDASIDILINNAGVALAGAFVEQDLERVESMIQLNIVSVTRLAHAAAKAFAARDRGAIVNISSVVGLAPELQMAVYGATKAYVTYFTQTLRLQLSPTSTSRPCCRARPAPRSGTARAAAAPRRWIRTC